MSIAEKLIIEGRIEGRVEGRIAGKIQILEELLDLPLTQDAVLYDLSPAELNTHHAALQQAYEARFKGRIKAHRIQPSETVRAIL